MPDMTSWSEMVKTVASAASVPVLAWVLGRRAQEAKEKLDTRSADQKQIEHLTERMDKLETRVDTLTSEKAALQAQITQLEKQIALMEIEKREYLSRDAMSLAQIGALEQRLTATQAELECERQKLAEVEAREKCSQSK